MTETTAVRDGLARQAESDLAGELAEFYSSVQAGPEAHEYADRAGRALASAVQVFLSDLDIPAQVCRMCGWPAHSEDPEDRAWLIAISRADRPRTDWWFFTVLRGHTSVRVQHGATVCDRLALRRSDSAAEITLAIQRYLTRDGGGDV